MGLRGKLLLALSAAFAAALAVSALIGWRAMLSLRQQLGADFARNTTLLAKQRILTPVGRELALARRFAASPLLEDWLLDEGNPEKKARFQREAEGYRQDFADHSYFVVTTGSLSYFYADAQAPSIDQPRYHIDPNAQKDAWFFKSVEQTDDYNLNVDFDPALSVTKVWINVVTKHEGKKLAMSGTGLDVTSFLKALVAEAAPGVTPMILNPGGYIQLHPNPAWIAGGSGVGARMEDKTLFRLIRPVDQEAAHRALAEAKAAPSGFAMFQARIDGRDQLVAVAWLPELQWYVTSVIDLGVARVLDVRDFLTLGAAVLALFGLFSVMFLVGVNRLLIFPLVRLEETAKTMAAGNYDVVLPAAPEDEIGELTRAFGGMAQTVREHTHQLESTVQARTRELTAANDEMRRASDKLRSSIEYASLMQRTLLPDAALAERFEGRQGILWLPRDVVGGDLYLMREGEGGYLVGVIDCAGHGVPGALATMLAWSALDNAVGLVPLSDPAAILHQIDVTTRGLARPGGPGLGVATSMDAALAWVEPGRRVIRFAGAKLPLYVCSGGVVTEIKGSRTAMGDRRPGVFENVEVPFEPGGALHLVTDGFFDQSGGSNGYGFGQSRFAKFLQDHANLSARERHERAEAALKEWRGAHPQRDDITLVSVPV